jgi:hypothetical protein
MKIGENFSGSSTKYERPGPSFKGFWVQSPVRSVDFSAYRLKPSLLPKVKLWESELYQAPNMVWSPH